MHLVKLGANKGVRTGTPRDVCGSVNQCRVMPYLGKMRGTKFPPPSGWVSNCVQATYCTHNPTEGSIPMTYSFCTRFALKRLSNLQSQAPCG